MEKQTHQQKVLVVGCGGLGSEIIKLLKGTDFLITVLDYDTIEVSNLNRQFFFSDKDVGKFKAQVISKKVNCFFSLTRVEELDAIFLAQFDLIFSCLDNIKARMQLNYLFFQANAKKLVDCGTEGVKAHIKLVTRQKACLYCIKDLYNTDELPYICSLKGKTEKITMQNRNAILKTIALEKDRLYKIENENTDFDDRCLRITSFFNGLVQEDLKTSAYEVSGILNNIIPSICTINSVCASFAFLIAFSTLSYDFVYIDCSKGFLVEKLEIQKDNDCFACNNG
ncbi:hypothetical protein GINT2_000065 [Glugoides intestinalis]